MRRTRLWRNTFQTLGFEGFLDSLLYFWSGLLSIKYSSVARTAPSESAMEIGKNCDNRHLLILLQTTYNTAPLVGPESETMIHSTKTASLSRAQGLFIKSTQDMKQQQLLRRHFRLPHFTKLTRDNAYGAALRMYACA